MGLFTVDRERCKRDGICVAECPRKIIGTDADGYPVAVEGAEEMCVVCGHCVVVCPHEAMSLTLMPRELCARIEDKLKLSPEQVSQFLKARRSVRSYKKEPLSREVIEKVIDIARYAPTGMNAQDVQWTVIGPGGVRRVAESVIDWMRALVKMDSPVAGAYNAKPIVEAWDAGTDFILRGAPHLIVTHAHKDNMLAPIDCSIALTYLMLAAVPYGAGTCWAGFVQLAASMSQDVLRSLGLPEGHKCNGAMMLGYPTHEFHRIPARKEPVINWV
jgi:nitroreductase/NAD-dependent dihydropyrimidine dehydrogenase PreA subunit